MVKLFALLKALTAISGAVKQFFVWVNARAAKQAGRNEQRLESLEEAERRGNEGDNIDQRIEGMTDQELNVRPGRGK